MERLLLVDKITWPANSQICYVPTHGYSYDVETVRSSEEV